MSDGQTGRLPGDAGWSQRHAETGGWPPPSPDQHRYGTGGTPTQPPDAPGGYSGWSPPPGPGAPWQPGDAAYGRLPTGAGSPTPRPAPPRRSRPGTAGTPVTMALIVACVLGYLLQQADPSITLRYGLVPVAVETGEYERLITSAFLHAGLLHLATNMLTLYIVGSPLERVLRTGRYLTIYLLSAIGGSLLSLWLSPAGSIGVGASGAIFGLFGALVVLRRQVGADARGLGVLIGLNLVISFAVPNISWQAHIGGLVTGALVALAIAATMRARRAAAGPN